MEVEKANDSGGGGSDVMMESQTSDSGSVGM